MKQTTRKIIWSTLIFVLVATLLCIVPTKGALTIVKVEPAISSADVGEILVVNITIIDVQNLYGTEVSLSWNASILTLIGVDVRLGKVYGVLFDPVFVAQNVTDQQNGSYTLAATSISPAPPFNGSGNVVRVTFNVTRVGNSSLDLSSKLYDYPPPDRWPRISLPINHVAIDGSFIIVPEFKSVVVMFAFVAAASLLFVLAWRHTRNAPGSMKEPDCKQNLLAKGCVTSGRS